MHELQHNLGVLVRTGAPQPLVVSVRPCRGQNLVIAVVFVKLDHKAATEAGAGAAEFLGAGDVKLATRNNFY